jgi:NDP-sugar pyrophosphorylase family protein
LGTVGVIPAAGYARRLQPIDCSKEVYPVGGRPVMDFVIERMRAAPCSELRVVTRPDKRDVIEHSARRRAVVVEAEPESLAESFLAGIEGLADSDLVLLGFPDSIWEPLAGYARLLEFRSSGWEVALGLLGSSELTRHEPVVFDGSGQVLGIEFKPEHPSSVWTWGLAVAPAGTLRALRGETEPGSLFDRLAGEGRVGALPLPGIFFDMGTPEGLRKAQEALGS